MLNEQNTNVEAFISFANDSQPQAPDNTIIELFEYVASTSPDAIALEFEKRTLSYLELDQLSNQLAHFLIKSGVRKEQLVPICMARCPEMIIGILGILKAGAAYVPVDPLNSSDRIMHIIHDTNATILLTNNTEIPPGINGQVRNICMDKHREDILQEPVTPVFTIVQGDDLAYVIYTSGSTGKPKGVLIGHKSLAASTQSRIDYYGDIKSAILIPSFAFDASVAVLFGTLISGGRIVLCRDEEIKETAVVKNLLERANMILCVPSYYQFLLEEGLVQNSALRHVILGGEKLEQQLADKHFGLTKNVSLYNEYGPTEATVWCTVAKVTENNRVTIGKPVNSVSVYIIDADMQLALPGEKGEIYIAGAQVARGYLNQPALTTEKFVPDPFCLAGSDEKMYKTGDLGRWLADGNIEYLGRLDDQVKIRGYRIELGEIENIILQSGLVKQVVVVPMTNKNGSEQLAAYIVPNNNFSREVLNSYLDIHAPDYMVPSAIVELNTLPLTHNGKVDKRALPLPAVNSLHSNEYIAPSNEIEKGLVRIWQHLLPIERIGVQDNFFHLGGDSLLVMKMASMVRSGMNMQLSINDVFIHKTISALSLILEKQLSNQDHASTKYLVPIRTTGTNNPLYLVAGGGGSAGRFMKFAEMLDPDQPVYALQPPIDRALMKKFPDNIEDIATKFIDEILTQNPEGPYSLGGHCLGGIIAYEMAKQLQQSGK